MPTRQVVTCGRRRPCCDVTVQLEWQPGNSVRCVEQVSVAGTV